MDDEKILTRDEIKRIIEAILFASGYPVTFEKLAETIGVGVDEIESVVDEYITEYDNSGLVRGVQLLKLGKACQLVTKEVFADYIKAALGIRDGGNLSKASLETLAIVAYNQPVTRAYVEQVRGVDSTYSVSVLLERELIEEKGHLDVPGRPRLFGTTENFLRVFGLSSIDDLPPVALPTMTQTSESETDIEPITI
ncbi:MAG: SMC-Scp complex subunit ScpB [Clostridia bacterium]|nr:SMC-Scp complex subunit ScpB [Clostridia bacterium]